MLQYDVHFLSWIRSLQTMFIKDILSLYFMKHMFWCVWCVTLIFKIFGANILCEVQAFPQTLENKYLTYLSYILYFFLNRILFSWHCLE